MLFAWSPLGRIFGLHLGLVLQLFHFFILVAPSSSPRLPPRPSFLLVPPSSLFLFLPRPALSQSLRIHKRPFFIEFDESVTDGRTDQRTDGTTDGRTNGRTDQRTEGPTDGRTDKASYRDARTHLIITAFNFTQVCGKIKFGFYSITFWRKIYWRIRLSALLNPHSNSTIATPKSGIGGANSSSSILTSKV